jgi:hypothetical protein
VIVEAAKLDATQYTVQYEFLRHQVIGPAGHPTHGDTAVADQPRGVGLALLLSEGIPGWLKAVERVLRAALAPRLIDASAFERCARLGDKQAAARGHHAFGEPGAFYSTRRTPTVKGGMPLMVMDSGAHQKVTTAHLSRLAYLYVRQSTLRQVLENTESTHRQYALRERAVALGWSLDRIIVIDSDLGQSGASAADREGF